MADAPEYDVVIIGGGINGAACASALTRRGYRILLLEQGDFASGTTAASAKLIHGGLRYLETALTQLSVWDAALVHEALQSREALLREQPHLVKPLPFVLPVYRGDPRPGWYVRTGLLLYDLFSPRKVSPWHRSFSLKELRRQEPTIESEDLRSAYLFYDAQVVMPERLCLEYLSEARDAGADLRNYSSVDFVIVDNGVAQGVDYHDVLSGERHSARARLILNAAGPWVDAVLEATGQRLKRRIGATKGSHLVLNLHGRGPQHGILASARADGRHIFIVPWLDHHIIGTTDIRVDDEATLSRPEDWEVDYLLSEAGRILPGIGVDREHVLYGYSGVRPLPYSAGSQPEGAITRRSFVIDHSEEGVAGLFSLVGGKLTTARRLARTATRAVADVLGTTERLGRPRALPVRGPDRVSFLPAATQENLRDRYGPRAAAVAAYAAVDPELAKPISPLHHDIGAQVVYGMEHEGARTIGDVLLRRTPVGLTHDLGRAAAPNVARIMAQRLGWGDDETAQAVRDYEMELHRTFSVFDRGAGATPPPQAETPSEEQPESEKDLAESGD